MPSSRVRTNSIVKVEVVYALPDQQYSRLVELVDGASAAQALQASGFVESFDGVSAASPIGVFGERVAPEDQLRDGDRLEIYRELIVDPKQARRKRAVRQKG